MKRTSCTASHRTNKKKKTTQRLPNVTFIILVFLYSSLTIQDTNSPSHTSCHFGDATVGICCISQKRNCCKTRYFWVCFAFRHSHQLHDTSTCCLFIFCFGLLSFVNVNKRELFLSELTFPLIEITLLRSAIQCPPSHAHLPKFFFFFHPGMLTAHQKKK